MKVKKGDEKMKTIISIAIDSKLLEKMKETTPNISQYIERLIEEDLKLREEYLTTDEKIKRIREILKKADIEDYIERWAKYPEKREAIKRSFQNITGMTFTMKEIDLLLSGNLLTN